MRLLHALILCIATSSSFAQSECKAFKDEIDPITKQRKLIYKTRNWIGAWFVAKDTVLHLEKGVGGASLMVIHDGSPITFLFTDDTTLELRQAGTEVSDYRGQGSYELNCFMLLSPTDLQVLSSKSVKLIRYALSEYNLDRPMKENHAAEFQEAARCLQENVRKP